MHLPRGYRWTRHGRVWISLGGAHSIDRKWRTTYVDWWPEEIISAGDVRSATAAGPVDVMVCHDAPEGVPILTKLFADNPAGVDEFEQVLSAANRELVSQVVDSTRPSHLWHGHYHLRLEDEVVAADGHVTQVHGLDCDGTTIDRNLVIVDTLPVPSVSKSPCLPLANPRESGARNTSLFEQSGSGLRPGVHSQVARWHCEPFGIGS